jgi:hypothetical protein
MATITALPPEILFLILKITLDYRNNRGIRRSLYTTLLATSVVARAWRQPSQGLLWRVVVLNSSVHADRWLEQVHSSSAFRITLTLELYNLESMHVPAVISSARGIRELVLWDSSDDVPGNPQILSFPSLKGIHIFALRR